MKATLIMAMALVVVGCSRGPGLLDIHSVNPAIRLDIRYATENNFTHHKVYDTAACFLVPEAARALSRVEKDLEPEGLELSVFDCYRPLSVQRKFWELVPDERYVANPAKGSRHNRGAAVDLTLVRLDGSPVPMPTGYDEFSEKAHRYFMALPPDALRNRDILEKAMARRGFVPLPTEWWHFDLAGWEKYPVLDVPISGLLR
jgi:zinc D-Ala-D-Ala dipeptidase